MNKLFDEYQGRSSKLSGHSISEMYDFLQQRGMFDSSFYLAKYIDVAESGYDPLMHYLEFGTYEGRLPAAYFDPEVYRRENPDVTEAGVEPFFHFCAQGLKEGRRVPSPERGGEQAPVDVRPESAIFDREYYLAANPDVAEANIDPEVHYSFAGEREGRRPNKYFQPDYYAQTNPDVLAAGIGLFEHYQSTGWREGRLYQNPASTRSSYKRDRHILFIGHDAIQAGAQLVLLETVKWYAEHTDYKVSVILCDVGPLIPQYAMYGEVFVFNNYNFSSSRHTHTIASTNWDCIYTNTVRTGGFWAKYCLN